MLERTLNERYPGSALDHLDSARNQHLGSGNSIFSDVGQSCNYDYLAGTPPDLERIWQWQAPQTPTMPLGRIGNQVGDLNASQLPASPLVFVAHALSLSAPRNPSTRPPIQEQSARLEGVDEIPTATAASFFRTYFQAIHPQYPFLSVKDCGVWYDEWKLAPPGNPISGWPAFFVKMVNSFICTPTSS